MTSVPVFDSSSFENTGLSLDDLEKKNYEKIVNNMKSDSSDYFNSDFDDSGVDEYISGSNDTLNESNEVSQPTFEQEISNVNDIPSESTTFESELNVPPAEDTETISDSVQTENPFAFGVEEQPVVESSDDVSENVVQPIPELNDDIVSSDSSSNNGDIWKF